MKKALLPALMFLLAVGCRTNEQSTVRLKVLLGATTTIAPGDVPIQDSIIVIAGDRIQSAGLRRDVRVPKNSDRTDVTGRWIVPAPGSRIKPDETANLLILKAAPKGTTPADPSDVSSRIVNGEWKF